MRLLAITLLAVAVTASAHDARAQVNPGATKVPAAATKQQTKTPPATKQDTKAAAPAPVTKQDTKAAAPGTKTDTKGTATKGAPAAGQGRGLTIAAETTTVAKVPVILRESYDYDAAGRRDPFFSLMATTDLRPTIADLKLTSVLYHPTRPVAIMRDVTTNTQYRVTLGTMLGRMRVSRIRPRVVIFTIEEFGLNRQDSLFLGDTTKVRAR
jgi:hypothetical protein